ncbi:MAG TPA: ATP-dependent DNA helicase RecQ [Acidobacteriaceae bacterium]|nr:ATP-dependent DNA helicase RecQ [Acidobacteriaceae bacterium]
MTPSEKSRLLHEALQRVFGFASFRANQEAVCQAAMDNRDVLLVMPTGSGKSLCYQLPAVARGGTALVVSPLIALMDDQAAKLAALGLPVARIHSGLERSVARKACIDYLQGQLQFLFIAPERLRVPGFAELLAKRKPSLIAIDEAHCISQWGHDFRPDYRMLGHHLKSLRPAPVMALTATATPLVQKDIAEQLELGNPARFIHGFRRENLAIEVVEVSLPRRNEIVCTLLREPARRPAIIYTPTRKHAETLATELSSHAPAAAYHAGLEPETRERVQEQFLAGRLDVVVATIAFGMGIDKPDVRTVIHTALPASLEGYYQEIGRAGRDGRNSRTILMHSYADQRTHDFFFKRDYPPLDTLTNLFRALGSTPRPREELREALKMEAEDFDKALEKLYAYGGAEVDFSGNARQGQNLWRDPYSAQAGHRRKQMELVRRYAEGTGCRMSGLVRHFGDFEDGERPCGLCDFCNPGECAVQRFRSATRQERRVLCTVLDSLRSSRTRSAGRLHQDNCAEEGMSRNDFEALLDAMKRAGLIAIEDASFEKNGQSIPYRRVSLTEEGEALHSNASVELLIKDSSQAAAPSSRKPAEPAARRKSAAGSEPVDLSPEAQALEQRLKAWRQSAAKKTGVPPFLILHDHTLRLIASARPTNLAQLLTLQGIGPAKAEKLGPEILRLCMEI